MQTSTEPLVKLEGINRWFGEEHVLRGVDLKVAPGSVTALLGRNGCGKSTLIRIVAGTLARDQGEARVLGKDPEQLSPADRLDLMWITDECTALPHWRVGRELDLIAGMRRGRFERARALELLERWEVPLGKRFSELSRGQQARFRLAVAIAARPRLLLLDEPALGLDLFARRDLLEVVVEVVSELEAGVLIASHQLEDVERISDRIAFLREGSVIASGTPDALRDAHRQVHVETDDPAALQRACAGLLGVRRATRERDDPPGEFTVHFSDHCAALESDLLAAANARLLQSHRPTLSEVFLEVLGAPSAAQEVGA